MLIDLIVASALLLSGLYLWAWYRSPALRDRIEAPKYHFLARLDAQERARAETSAGNEEHTP